MERSHESYLLQIKCSVIFLRENIGTALCKFVNIVQPKQYKKHPALVVINFIIIFMLPLDGLRVPFFHLSLMW